jgi:hypothetical protein
LQVPDSDNQPSRVGLVVGVAETQDVGVVGADFLAVGDLEEGEVTLAVAGEGVLLVDDTHIHLRQGGGYLVVEIAVRDRVPDAVGLGRLNGADLFEGCLAATGMEN